MRRPDVHENHANHSSRGMVVSGLGVVCTGTGPAGEHHSHPDESDQVLGSSLQN